VANPKILIAGGCSFTQVPNNNKNWPIFLRDKLKMQAYFLGAGSAGNDLISKRVIHRVIQCLKIQKYKPEDLLVGIMWSGVDRGGYYLSNPPLNYFKIDTGGEYFYGNPNSISSELKYYIVKPGWEDELSNVYYKHFYDEIGNLIDTLEHVLRVQWFLKLHNIKYFFTNYHDLDAFSGEFFHEHLKHPEVSYLYEQIDFDNFLPVKTMGDWNLESGFTFPSQDNHPTSEMSEGFVDRVIIPHLKKKGYVT